MLKIIVLVGIPGSGKSSWAKIELSKEPLNWCRINNDDIRSMVNGSVYSSGYEKLITETRLFLIETALKKDKNVIVDNLNLNPRHWEDALSIAKKVNKPIQVFEKHFYIDLLEAIERDSKREGIAKVGEKVIRHWWNESGKEQFKFYQSKYYIQQGNK